MNARVEPVAEPAEAPTQKRILVIAPPDLAGFVQALGPVRGIREHHRDAGIVLLVAPAYTSFARQSGYADEVWQDPRPDWWHMARWMGLTRRLRRGRFDRVYDLENSRRTATLFQVMGRPEWSGSVAGCSHPIQAPRRVSRHPVERQREQLHDAGIAGVPLTDLSWVTADIDRFGLRDRYVLIVAGGLAGKSGSTWPAAKYAALARRLVRRDLTPVLVGDEGDAEGLDPVRGTGVGIRNLVGRTSLQETIILARGAVGAIGNDTDMMHMVAMAGCPSLVLFSGESDPVTRVPRAGAEGGKVQLLRRTDLRGVSVEEVEEALPFIPA